MTIMSLIWYHRFIVRCIRAQIWIGATLGVSLIPTALNRFGIWCWFEGDTVIWTWPWTRRDARSRRLPWISLGFSGNGDFGDARYPTLRALRADWIGYDRACAEVAPQCPSTLSPLPLRVIDL